MNHQAAKGRPPVFHAPPTPTEKAVAQQVPAARREGHMCSQRQNRCLDCRLDVTGGGCAALQASKPVRRSAGNDDRTIVTSA